MERAEQSYDFDNLGNGPAKEGMSGCAKVGIGCGIASLVMLIGVGLIAWWVSNNIRQLGADFAGTALKQAMSELQIPADQETRIFARIDDVVQQFKNEEISMQEVGLIFKQISEGPLISAGMALVVERAYLDDSGLDDEERDAARIVIQRFSHGIMQEQIPEDDINSVLDNISRIGPDGQREFRHPVSDDDLRSFIADAKEAADLAEIPESVPTVNFADEFDKAIDMALAGESARSSDDSLEETDETAEPQLPPENIPPEGLPPEAESPIGPDESDTLDSP